jgi:hypothetical protein
VGVEVVVDEGVGVEVDVDEGVGVVVVLNSWAAAPGDADSKPCRTKAVAEGVRVGDIDALVVDEAELSSIAASFWDARGDADVENELAVRDIVARLADAEVSGVWEAQATAVTGDVFEAVVRAERVVVALIDDCDELDPLAVVRVDAELFSDALHDAEEVATVPVCVAVWMSDSVAAAEAVNFALVEWFVLCVGLDEASAEKEFETEAIGDFDVDGELLALLVTLAVPEVVEKIEGDEREVWEDDAVFEDCSVPVLAAVTLDDAVEHGELTLLADAPKESDEELVE